MVRSASVLVLMAGAACAQGPSFTLIPAPVGASTTRGVTAMSGDGSTVVGPTDTLLDYVWTSGGGTVRPAPMAGGSTTHFRGVSADGSVTWGGAISGRTSGRSRRSLISRASFRSTPRGVPG